VSSNRISFPRLRRPGGIRDQLDSLLDEAARANLSARETLRNLHVVPFGVDRSLFGPGRRVEALRRAMLAECGLGPEAALLVNVGRHHPEKRIGLLIDATTRVQRIRPIGLYIVGDGYSHGSVRARAARAKHVYVAGRINDRDKLAGMVASADALVHAGASETYCFAVAEALCVGTPVIAPSAGGAGELTGPDYGETFAAGSAGAAADAILRLLARDRAQLSRAAQGAADRRIGDMSDHFEKLLALYTRIEADSRATRSV
jgi:alpha-1,6-mannosyltransferase